MKETNTYKKLKGRPTNNHPRYLAIHHSAAPKTQTIEAIEWYHIKKGWDGIGYHYAITYKGDVYKGRPEHVNGAHTIGINTKSIGILLVGDFDKNMPSEAQISSLRALMKDLTSRYPIEDIAPHRKWANKSCYGTNLSDDWAKNLLNSKVIKDKLLKNATLKELVLEILKRIA